MTERKVRAAVVANLKAELRAMYPPEYNKEAVEKAIRRDSRRIGPEEATNIHRLLRGRRR